MKRSSADRYSSKCSPRPGNIQTFFPVAAETGFLWAPFIGKSSWIPGAWVHHPQTVYLDVEFVDEGELFVFYGGEKFYVPAGSAVVIPPGESKLSAGKNKICRKHFLGISGPVLTNNLAAMNLNKVSVLNDFSSQEFKTIYQQLHELFKEKNPDTVRDCAALIYKMLLLLSQSVQKEPYPPELQHALYYINSRFALPLQFADICRAAQCGKSKLQWQFKHYLDSTPMKYLTQVRMSAAVKLLENTDDPVKEIADKCGFSDSFYFSNTFRRFYGVSPRTYRKDAAFARSEEKA